MFISYLFGPPVVVAAPDGVPILLLNFLTALDNVILFFTCLDIELAPDWVVSLSSGEFCKIQYYADNLLFLEKGRKKRNKQT